jgi:hypothetical protein
MYTQITLLPVKGNIHGQWYAQVEKLFAWLTTLLLAGMTLPLWESQLRLVLEKIYEVAIMGRY